MSKPELHLLIGDLGHLLIILSFVTSVVCIYTYQKVRRASDLTSKAEWLLNARITFYIHVFSVVGVVASLFIIIYNHYFEYHYAYSHSSLRLPAQYMVSCFWEGQEGSFLLWLFWQALLGIILIFTQRQWEAPVMIIVSMVQAFLASMILGVVIPYLNIKIGSSPFILLRDAFQDPIFKTDPNFIPRDGTGLNPLLQNYWMVIHPPTLFLGFALSLFPFAFCLSGLWERKYSEWIKPALPWTLLSGAVLGLGILMGGYWAYETLNFGGYWNWDPVENAVYVPWLVLIASMHTMITYKNSSTALKASVILVISVFILIIYSTFLARSGILGDASVHSFTDLGLSGQLLLYLFFFLIGAIVLMVVRWKEIPASQKEVLTYSREFWIFLGATILCLMGFQVLVPTSYPVINKVAGLFGFDLNIATPANQVEFYSNFQLGFSVLVALISGTGQFFWWRRMDKENWKKEVVPVLLITLIVFAIVISLARVTEPAYMLLTLSGIYLVASNARILGSVIKTNPRLSGGALAHIGVGLMLIGIMFSAGKAKIVSLNNNGLLINRDLGTEFNRDNLFLFINEPRTMADYEIEYRGERFEATKKSGYVKKTDVALTTNPFVVIAKKDIYFEGEKLYAKQDTFEINPENTYYEIELRKNNQLAAILYPRVQVNEEMGGFIASPDIKKDLSRDLYTHVSGYITNEEEPTWSKQEEATIQIGQQFFVNDYVAVLEDVKRIFEIPGYEMEQEDIAVQAQIKVQGEREEYLAEPIFLIRNRNDVNVMPVEIKDLGVKLVLLTIHPDTNSFTIGMSTRQKDWVVIKAKEFPLINVLWLGTGVLMIGFSIAMVRRFKDHMKDK